MFRLSLHSGLLFYKIYIMLSMVAEIKHLQYGMYQMVYVFKLIMPPLEQLSVLMKWKFVKADKGFTVLRS